MLKGSRAYNLIKNVDGDITKKLQHEKIKEMREHLKVQNYMSLQASATSTLGNLVTMNLSM